MLYAIMADSFNLLLALAVNVALRAVLPILKHSFVSGILDSSKKNTRPKKEDLTLSLVFTTVKRIIGTILYDNSTQDLT